MGVTGEKWVRRGAWVVAAALLLRAAAAISAPLIDDEAYYWLWARHLDWGYLDHPPLVAYLISLTTRLGSSPWLIRLGPLLLGALTTYALYLLGRELFTARAGMIAAILFQIVPVLAGAGLLATPDAALFLAWTLALRFAWQALHSRPGRWPAAGVAVGVGLLSKLPMILLPAGLALYVVLRSRRWLRRPEPYAALLLAAALFSPVIYWNARHGWAGVKFVLAERLGGTPLGLSGVLKLAEEQLAFVLVLLPALAWALVVALRSRDERLAFLGWTSVPVLFLPFIPAFAGGWPHGNWLGPGYLALCIALGALWTRTTAALAVVNGAAVLYGLAAAIAPVLPLPPGAGDIYGWREAGARVRLELARPATGPVLSPSASSGQALPKGSGPAGAVVVADRYQVAAQLAYHARAEAVTLLPCPPLGSIWPPPAAYAGREAVAVIDSRWQPVLQWQHYAASVEEAPPLDIELRGRVLRTFRIYRLHHLRPAPCPSR